MNLIISSLEEMGQFRSKVTHVLSIVDPDDGPYIPAMGIPRERHLVLFCDDVDSRAEAFRRERLMPGSKCNAPSLSMVKKALAFTKGLPDHAKLLVHCGHGISRSPALAFAILCQAEPDRPEGDVIQKVLKLRPQACPNALIVAHADQLLGREGRMSRAVQAAKLFK